jgi:RNA polymerase-binding transcription factor DksA
MTERLHTNERPTIDEGEVRRLLEVERARLAGLIAGLEHEGLDEAQADAMGESSARSQHNADNASDTFERERDLSLLLEFRVELEEVSQALIRLSHGRYGVCEACHVAIPSVRLEALPSTRYCVTCAASVERRSDLSNEASPTWSHLGGASADFLPGDDEADPADRLGPEEAAMRVLRLGESVED